MRVCAKLLQSCLTLYNPMDCSPPGSSLHEILQARILEWVAMPFSKESAQPSDQTQVSYMSPASAAGFFTTNATCVCSVIKSCPTFCDPMDCSLPGSSVHGIFQARPLEWVAISSTRGSSQPRDLTRVSSIGRQILYH